MELGSTVQTALEATRCEITTSPHIALQSDAIELLPIAEALDTYDWLREQYYWKAVEAGPDDAPAGSAGSEPDGYFVRVKKGTRDLFPLQACLYITQEGFSQTVHNIVIVEEDAELHLITGCATHENVRGGAHHAVTEAYVGQRARFVSTMVHSWGPDMVVRPRSGTVVDAGGSFVSNYYSFQPAGNITSSPHIWLDGEGASAKSHTVVMGFDGTTIDTGDIVYLNAADTSAELAHRAVCMGGRIFQRGLLVGNARCRAHVDCAGMVLEANGGGMIESVPGLRSTHPEAQMSHEASIGRIAPEQVEYLQSRGMEERDAISLMIRGFLGMEQVALTPELDANIARIAELAGH